MTKQSGKKRKSLGFTELEWTCPFCDGRNPGSVHICGQCGAPQAGDVEFNQRAQEELITDEAKVAQIESKKPDIHCAFCNTRNAPDAVVCKQCGAELAEGVARQEGRVVGRHRQDKVADVACPSCGTMNPGNAAKCRNCQTRLPSMAEIAEQRRAEAEQNRPKTNPKTTLILVGVLLAVCLGCYFLFFRTTETVGTVQEVQWTRSIGVLGLVEVEAETWSDSIPSNAESVGFCSEEVRYTQSQPEAGLRSEEVCGTPYTVDQGNGFAEVVTDCEYQIYDQMCEYTYLDLAEIDQIIVSGEDFAPFWPEAFALGDDEELGDRTEEYEIIFRADGETYRYTTESELQFLQLQDADQWILNVNSLGAVTSIEPDN